MIALKIYRVAVHELTKLEGYKLGVKRVLAATRITPPDHYELLCEVEDSAQQEKGEKA